ncbi:MAG: hypothetical protein OS130_01285 [Thermodesulfobacteriota bacterium]|jgi:hypothetical protein|nr:MAG: hypothetical protein OS130_01285 [Thermodesulfobacteriota bacterium]
MSAKLLYENEWLIFIVSSLIFFLVTEVGFRVGNIKRSSADESTKSQTTTLQGAILGLLGLLLAFTISMALIRIEERKQMVLEEANAIGTAYLRAQLLPEPEKTEISRLLRQYVDVRLEGIRPGHLKEAITKSETIHDQLWLQAVAVGKKVPQPVPTGLFIQSLNDVIDVHSKRLRAGMDHVPESIFLLLFTIAIFSMGAIGYGCGLGNGHFRISRLSMAVIISMVILTIIDLDQPGQGLIKVSQQSMISLRDNINKPAP